MRILEVNNWKKVYSNDLPLGTNIDSKLLLYADDTSVLISGTSTH